MPLVRPAEAMTAFQLVTLGGAALRDAQGQVPMGLGSGKPLALLCYLALSGEVRRDDALMLLWGDVEEERARNAFRQALHRLRLALGEELVIGDRQFLRLSAENRLCADVRDFDAAVAADRFDDAVALYAGDFLAGFDVGSDAFDEWVERERVRLRERCKFAAQRAAQRALADGRLEAADVALQRLRQVATSDAVAVEAAAAGFVSLGRHADAAEIIAEFARKSSAEGVAVPRSLQVMRDRLLPAAPTADAVDRPGDAAAPPPLATHSADIARLLTLWNAVRENSGGTVVLASDDEDTKARLVRDFADGVRALGTPHVLCSAESMQGLSAPYAAVSAALRPLLRAPGISGASPHLLAEAARLLPELRDSFQLPPVEAVEEDTARLRTCEGVAALLEAAAFERRVCLIIEDVHHSSSQTIELLGHLSARLRNAPVLLVLTCAASGISPTVERLVSLAGGANHIPSDRYIVRVGESDAAPRPAGFVATYFPNWRFLSGAAIATAVAAIVATTMRPSAAASVLRTTDTLLIATDDDAQRNLTRSVAMTPSTEVLVSAAGPRRAASPAWADSIQLPWVNATPAPNGRFVGVERVTATGSEVYVISSDRRDTARVSTTDGDAFALGWSPDGSTLLISERRQVGADYAVGLYAVSAIHRGERFAIDTSAHTVSEAAWSPDGSHIAWVARESRGEEEVFVAWANGRNRRNVSNHPAQDDHLSWGPDGSLLAFTSRRDGNAELYTFDFIGERLWRLTNDPAHDDRATFDADARLVAFESTRGGAGAVYLMPTLGGEARRIGDSTASYSIIGWRSSHRRHLDHLELSVPASAKTNDTIILRARGVDQLGAEMPQWHAQWSVIDGDLLRLVTAEAKESPPTERRFRALREGLARVVVSVGGWRTDTAYVKVGDGPVTLLRDDFSTRRISPTWRLLGVPQPHVGSVAGNSALVINADRQWGSGVLSTNSMPLRPGLRVQGRLIAPFETHSASTTATLALVAADPPGAIDSIAPRALRLVSVTWNSDARRLVYAAERDVFAEPVPKTAASANAARDIAIAINPDGTVSFIVDGEQRWTSTLRVVRGRRARSVQLWLGGQDTGNRVGFRDVSVTLDGAGASRR